MKGYKLDDLLAKGLTVDEAQQAYADSMGAKKPSKPRHQPGTMNNLEARFALYLDSLKAAGEVKDYWFEGIALRIGRPKCFFHPDFLIHLSIGASFEGESFPLIIVDTKGFARDDSLVKGKVTADKFPFPVFFAYWRKKCWSFQKLG